MAVSLLFLVLVNIASAASSKWGTLSTPRFVVVSQLTEKETRAWALEFSQFIESLRSLIKVDERALPPLTVVLFERERDFAPYKPARPDGKRADNIAGYFCSRETWSVVGLAQGITGEDTRHLIQHEGVHWYMSADTRNYPLWFQEGLAEVFATFNIKDGKARWGDLVPWHVQWLREEKLIRLERLLHVSQTDKLFNEGDRTGFFYAQSWALVHFMLFGKREGDKSQLESYLAAWRKGENPDEAFRAAFGKDYAGMDHDLDRYVFDGKFFNSSSPPPKVEGAVWTFAQAQPASVEIALARLALVTRRHDLVARHIERALALAPEQPEGYELRAMLERDRLPEGVMSNNAVLVAAERAVALGSKDAQAYEYAGSEKLRAAIQQGGANGADARAIANLYERAINLRPNLRIAYVNLAGVVSQAEPLRPQDIRFLEAGRFRFPDEGKILIGLAMCADRNGDRTTARQILETLRTDDHVLTPDDLQVMKSLETRWMMKDHYDRVDAALKERKFEQALAIFDEMIRTVDDFGIRATLAQQRRSLNQNCLIGTVDDMVNANQLDAARARIEELLKGNDLLFEGRSYLKKRLEWINESLPQPAGTVGAISGRSGVSR